MKRILKAINEGVKRGLLQFDSDQLSFNKDKGLNNTSSELIIDEIINSIIKNDTITIDDYKFLLSTSYQYQVKNKEELKKIIKIVIDKIGADCNLNWLDTSDITDMSGMFRNSKFNGDISKWNVSKVKNMSGMFDSSKFNRDISEWDVSSVNNMSCMFNNSKFNGDISEWDVSNVKDMYYMFSNSIFNSDISKWNVSNVTYMQYMFMDSNFNSNISKWTINKGVKTRSMFDNCPIKDEYKPKFD